MFPCDLAIDKNIKNTKKKTLSVEVTTGSTKIWCNLRSDPTKHLGQPMGRIPGRDSPGSRLWDSWHLDESRQAEKEEVKPEAGGSVWRGRGTAVVSSVTWLKMEHGP